MQQDDISDANRYIVNSEHVGPIFPNSIKELARAVYLNDGAVVKGGIFANALQITGGRVVAEQSVYAHSFIRIQMTAPGLINFKSTVVSEKSVLIEGPGNGNHIRLRGDLAIESGHLRNMIIYGNVYGEKLVLEKCAVFGGVYARETLDVRDSMIGTFNGTDVTLGDGTTLWLTNGVARGSLAIQGKVRGFTFALPRVFSDIVTHGEGEIPDATMDLAPEDIRSLPLGTFRKALESRFPEISGIPAKGPTASSTEHPGTDGLAPGPMIPVLAEEIIPDDDLRKYLRLLKDTEADEKTIRYFGLEPRLFNISSGMGALAINRQMHRLLLDPSGHLKDEERFDRYDRAVLDYLAVPR